jgi:hypothetical protein
VLESGQVGAAQRDEAVSPSPKTLIFSVKDWLVNENDLACSNISLPGYVGISFFIPTAAKAPTTVAPMRSKRTRS